MSVQTVHLQRLPNCLDKQTVPRTLLYSLYKPFIFSGYQTAWINKPHHAHFYIRSNICLFTNDIACAVNMVKSPICNVRGNRAINLSISLTYSNSDICRLCTAGVACNIVQTSLLVNFSVVCCVEGLRFSIMTSLREELPRLWVDFIIFHFMAKTRHFYQRINVADSS